MVWLVRGFTLLDPRKAYPGFYLSPQQSYVLSVVHDHGPITPGDAAKLLRLEKSHLTKIANSLIEMGAIKKQPDPRDRRRLMLSVTSKGKHIFQELNKVSIASYSILISHVPPNDREKVIKSVEILLQAMKRMREDYE